MNRLFTIFVTDTSPLITLALADALSALLQPRLPVSIPDAVFTEATRVRGAAGASRIVQWILDHTDQVSILPTETGIDQLRRIEEGRSTRGLGEQASIELLDRLLATRPTASALLLFEDTDILKRRAIVDDRVALISTGDFLRELEMAHLIQSADHILDEAAQAGRNLERQRQSTSDPQARDLLRRQLLQRDKA